MWIFGKFGQNVQVWQQHHYLATLKVWWRQVSLAFSYNITMLPAEGSWYQVVPLCFQCRSSVENQSVTSHLSRPISASLPLQTHSMTGRWYRCRDSICASTGESEKIARTSSYHTAQDCTKWPEIPQPHTGWGTWYGWKPSTLEADGNDWRYTL